MSQPQEALARPEEIDQTALWVVKTIFDVKEEIEQYAHVQDGLWLPTLAPIALQGHLLEHAGPGSGKSNLINVMAATIHGATKKSIQGNADQTPADIFGVRMYNRETGEWELHEAPLSANLVLFDEISRSSARAHSALNQALVENRFTPNGSTQTYDLPDPFMLLAAQNETDPQQGTNPMNMSLRDRFLVSAVPRPYHDNDYDKIDAIRVRVAAGIEATRGAERPARRPEDLVAAQITLEGVSRMSKFIKAMRLDEGANQHAREIIYALREDTERVDIQKSTISYQRAIDGMRDVGRLAAVLSGNPLIANMDNINEAATHVLRHRLAPTTDAQYKDVQPEDIIYDAVEAATAITKQRVAAKRNAQRAGAVDAQARSVVSGKRR